MGVLDKIRSYQKLQKLSEETTAIPQPSMLASSPHGETSQQDRSFLQSFILKMMEEKGVPIQALRFVPGFGEQVTRLLYGNPYECHSFFAEMLANVQQLLEKDEDHDPARKREDEEFTGTRYDFSTGRTESSTGRTFNGTGSDGIREVDVTRPFTQAIPVTLSNIESFDSGQQATISRSVEYGRPDSQSTLQELE